MIDDDMLKALAEIKQVVGSRDVSVRLECATYIVDTVYTIYVSAVVSEMRRPIFTSSSSLAVAVNMMFKELIAQAEEVARWQEQGKELKQAMQETLEDAL